MRVSMLIFDASTMSFKSSLEIFVLPSSAAASNLSRAAWLFLSAIRFLAFSEVSLVLAFAFSMRLALVTSSIVAWASFISCVILPSSVAKTFDLSSYLPFLRVSSILRVEPSPESLINSLVPGIIWFIAFPLSTYWTSFLNCSIFAQVFGP